MITPILGLNFKRISPQNNSKTDFKTNPLRDDSFELQQKASPSFALSFGKSIVPRKAIFACCDRFSAKMEKTESVEKLRELSKSFLERLKKIVYNPEFNKEPDFRRYQSFRHELMNVLTNEKWFSLTDNSAIIPVRYPEMTSMSSIEYLTSYKQACRDTVKMIKEEMKYDTYSQSNKRIINANAIFDRLRKHRLKLCPFSIEGLNLLKGKKVKEPEDLFDFIKQPFSNAQKYGDRKPFKIVIEKATVEGQERYYALFINPDTKPILDAKIYRILEGNGYRVSSPDTTGIEGEGFGFGYIIRTLRRKGYEQDIPNLIERGREKGVCVRVPIIGIV